MRVAITLLFALLLVSCGGGGGTTIIPVQDVDPLGFWSAEAQGGGTWTIRTAGAFFVMDFPASDLIDFQLTVDGNSFTATGSETDLGNIERIDYLITGTITGDTMTGDWQLTRTRLSDGWVETENTPFTAVRTPE